MDARIFEDMSFLSVDVRYGFLLKPLAAWAVEEFKCLNVWAIM